MNNKPYICIRTIISIFDVHSLNSIINSINECSSVKRETGVRIDIFLPASKQVELIKFDSNLSKCP